MQHYIIIIYGIPSSPGFTKSGHWFVVDSGGELKIVAFLTEADPVQRILIHIGEPTTPARTAPARAPPDCIEADFDQTVLNDSEEAEPVPEFEFDQTVSW